jgi:integrase
VKAEIARQQAEEQARTLNSFGATMAAWMAATEAGLSVRTIKHRKAMLEKHVLPRLRDCPMADVTRKELRALLVALDKTAPVTARHCRGYINQCFDWAEEEDLVENNPTPNAKVLVYAGTRSVVPRKALPLNRLGDFLVTLEDAQASDPLTKAALKLLILTWCRTSEGVGARWAEFDLDAGIWVIPAERMKANEPHRVFLSRQAVDLLRNLRPFAKGEVLFPNRRRPEASMHRMTLTNWRKRWGFADEMDVHGLRALASTWANESGRYRPDVIEVALAHREGDRVRAAYNRAQFVGNYARCGRTGPTIVTRKLPSPVGITW